MDWLIGHLIGDYILQTDWQANSKTWRARRWMGLLIAAYHSALLTAAIAACAFLIGNQWPWWALLVIWSSHAIQDWTRFPTKLMEWRKQFTFFKDHMPQAYVWACIVVDNTLHLALLFGLDQIARNL